MSVPNPTPDSTCLITGASSGIGAEFARDMAARGYNVVLAARRVEQLKELAEDLRLVHGVDVLAVQCDVTVDKQLDKLLAEIDAAGKHVDILINNAGRGDSGKFFEHSFDAQMSQIDLNVRALTALTHKVLHGMIERGGGAVLNVASTAAFQPIPRQTVYAASKAYVLSFSEGLSRELRDTGVSCTALCPGPTKTEFFDAVEMERYMAKSPDVFWQDADDVAKIGIEGMFKRKRVVVPGITNRISALSGAYSPHSVSLQVLDRFWPVGKN